MDYEKAFDRAKSAYGTGAYDDLTLEFIFPELRKSEDEKIRKFLIDYFTSYKIGNVATKLNGYRIDDILAYLDTLEESVSEDDKDMIESIDMWLNEIEPKWVEKEHAWLEKLRTRLAEEPVSDDLEEAAETKYPTRWKKYPNDGIVRSEEYFDLNAEKRDAFKAGAEWQKEQDMDKWLKDRDGCFWDGVNEGKKAMKEKMMEGAVEGEICHNTGVDYLNYNIAKLDEYIFSRFKVGDKVRIIIVKEEQQ